MNRNSVYQVLHVFILALAALFIVMPLQAAFAVKTGSKWAVVVGINEYLKEVTPLQCADNDAESFRKVLIERAGFDENNVFLLTSKSKRGNRVPDKSNIIRWMSYVKSNAGPDDTFVFFFSGHGMDKDKESYLLTYEADPYSRDTLTLSALSVSDLRKILMEMSLSRVLLFIDACRNDPRSGKGSDDNVMTDLLSKNLVIAPGASCQKGNSECSFSLTFFSCAVGQRSYEWSEKRMGFFTYHLLKGLNGAAADRSGNVTLASLRRYIARAVPEALQKEKGNDFLQNPWVKGEESALAGEWIICRGAGAAETHDRKGGAAQLSPQKESLTIEDSLKPYPEAPDPYQAGIHRDRGDTYMLGKNYQKAVHEYREALRWAPDYMAAYESLGEAYVKAGDYENATAAYSQAVAINPRNAECFLKRGISYGKKGDFTKALSDLDKALELKPDYAVVHFYRGSILEAMKRSSEALDAYRRYIKTAPPEEEDEKQSAKARIVQLEKKR
ncbi:MAG: tetratricopeptide repeat protein [Vulcanimicrobiota bacterium]